MKLPPPATTKKYTKSYNRITPSNMPWMQLIAAVTTIVNDVDAVAYKG